MIQSGVVVLSCVGQTDLGGHEGRAEEIRRDLHPSPRLVKILERPVGQQVAPFQGLLESGIAVGYVFLPGAQFVACSSPGASAIKCCYAVFEC